MRDHTARRPRLRVASLGLTVLLAVSATACTSDPKDPAQERQDRVQARIEDTFSRSQASCIMKVLDGPTVTALDKGTALAADSEALRIYSNAVIACTA